jgi:hypothetical protein
MFGVRYDVYSSSIDMLDPFVLIRTMLRLLFCLLG